MRDFLILFFLGVALIVISKIFETVSVLDIPGFLLIGASLAALTHRKK